MAININLMDTYVHGLDLAVATGREDALDAELAETALSMSKEMGLDSFRTPGVFGPEVPCDESDAAHRRLLAYLGRRSQRSRRAICSDSPKCNQQGPGPKRSDRSAVAPSQDGPGPDAP